MTSTTANQTAGDEESHVEEFEADAKADADPSDVEPLRPIGDPPPTTVYNNRASAYISRVSMSATRIELTWSDKDNAVE